MIKVNLYIKQIIPALLTGCFFLLACENEIATVQNLGKKTLGVEEAYTIESYMSQNGKVKAKLTAPLMLRYLFDTPRVEFTKTMHVDFYDDTLGIESVLNCKYGRYIENDNKVFLRDSVVVYNTRSGDTLWTNELIWDQNKAEFYTDKPVKVKKEFNSKYIHGVGLKANQSFTLISIYNIQPETYFIVPDSTY